MKEGKDLFQEDVQDKIEIIKKRMSKRQGNLDRYILNQEAKIESDREELIMLGVLVEKIPRMQPELVDPLNEGEE